MEPPEGMMAHPEGMMMMAPAVPRRRRQRRLPTRRPAPRASRRFPAPPTSPDRGRRWPRMPPYSSR